MIVFDQLDEVAGHVADLLGADIIAIRLILSVLFGYPIAIIYSLYSSKWSIQNRQFYLLVCGIFLFLWNFGFDIIHMFIGIAITMLVNYLCFQSKISVIFAFVFNMGYLLSGSYIYNRGTYDINWTTPYCVLCLRLIGLSWDLFDGARPENQRSAQQNKSALKTFPGVLETLSFCFVPTAFISGPQFPMRHYQAFIDGSLRPSAILRNRSFAQRFIYNVKVQRTVVRFTMGVLGIILLSNLLARFPADRMLTKEFQYEWNFASRFMFMAVFSQITLFRYVAIWLIGEGACVLLGLGCTGYVHVRPVNQNKNGKSRNIDQVLAETRTKSALERRDSAIDWTQASGDLKSLTGDYDPTKVELYEAEHTACANISLANLILATNTDNLVAGFNINTNRWMLEYVYKRLRFLGNKYLSQFITLLFLALWHGTYSGYYVNFGLEFVTIAVEKDFLRIVKRSTYGPFLYTTTLGLCITMVFGKLHTIFLLATPLVAFYLLQFRLWYPVLKSTYFIGFIYLLWPLAKPGVKMLLPPRPSSLQADGDHVRNAEHPSPATADESKKVQ